MNIIAFSVDTTNICPMANSHAGGQLVTEYTLRAMSSLDTPESIQYLVGPSYTHSERDFYVQLAGSSDEYFSESVPTSGSILEVSPGRAAVNGYFVESLVPVNIDMIQLSRDAEDSGSAPLSGRLCIGLRTMFSTESTVAGSIAVENTTTNMYEGVQLVILPADSVVLPTDSPTNQSYVNMYLKLAEFTYANGTITNITNAYPEKCQYIPANRIDSIDGIISGDYIKKTGLNPKRLYVYSGKSNDPSVGGDTWCDATDSLMVWGDSIPQYTYDAPDIKKAAFIPDLNADSIKLVIPHKQVDGMKDSAGNLQYFREETLPLPKASFELGTPGIVGLGYTEKVKSVLNKINEFYTLPNGKQRAYIADLHDVADLPSINSVWKSGDYILIARDYTVDYASVDAVSAPSTLRVVCPGRVLSITNWDGNPGGIELDRIESIEEPLYDISDWAEYQNKYWDIGSYHGDTGDYFVYDYYNESTDTHEIFYYAVSLADDRVYSDPVLLYGGTPLASETTIGGFLNVDTANIDRGYVYLDSEGHLRLLDYGLLRSGAAAYQLGEDFTVPAGLDIAGIQEYLDEYVNQRVAFPNEVQASRDFPNLINIYIDLTSDMYGNINIYDIDSRFGAAVCLHITGDSTGQVSVNISNCERIKIDSNIGGSPVINLHNSCLYYDSDVMDYLNAISDLKLWYEKYSNDDPNLVADGLTIRQIATSGQYTVQDYASSEYWNPSNPNDNHFMVALQSITFGADGYICGCGVFVRNESTSNVSEGTFVLSSEFQLPIGPGLIYPTSRMTQPIKVTGQFISAYVNSDPDGYMIQNTSFSLVTPVYGTHSAPGNIAFLVNAHLVEDPNPVNIDVWDTGSFHYFEGMAAL